jgi:PAS domain S-box-containing protein
MGKQHQGTVLYVDDDELNRTAFALVFRDAGFEVMEAATGCEALRLAAEKPDLIVLDVNLPDINGFEVCRHIKAHPATTFIPVMHMSGVYVRPEDRTHALEDGADVYLTKPVEPHELVAQARVLLRIHQAEERAAAAARQWQATFAAINDGVCLLDRQGRVQRCNAAAERILQRSAGEILGQHGDDLLLATAGPSESSVLGHMLKTRRREMAELAVGHRWLQAIADPMLAEDGSVAGAVYILSDVTERKRLEEQLRHSQKMEALGRLASGIAHDFNNLLTAVSGNASLLLAVTAEDDPDRELLRAIDQAAWRAAELTQQLLGFSRRAATRLQPTDPRACLAEVAAILRRTIARHITLEERSTPDVWMVRADPGQINQVLMNLCLNARDAMPEGGLLLLEAANAVLVEGQTPLSAEARPGEFVRLRVRDTGQGIPPEVLPHLFEPFFTTKEVGKGTGLGLATVYGIVGQHQGWVECTSAVNQGSCFDVYLPRYREGLDQGRGESTPPAGEGKPPVPPAGPGQGAELGKPSADPGPPKEETRPPGEESRSGLMKAEAEELLDWLEIHGAKGQVELPTAGKGFTVRWQQDALGANGPRRCRRRRRRPCPACGSTSPPYMKREMVPLSWVLLGLGVLIWPLFFLGLVLRREVWRCWDCHQVLGRGRLALGW